MAFRPAFRSAFQPALRPAFGGALAGESELQQATIAAWDMQEESGPLLPAKGGIEIPAFNSPGFTAGGPAGSLSARTTLGASSQEFYGATEFFDVTRYPCFEFWVKFASAGISGDSIASNSLAPQSLSSNAQWQLSVVGGSGTNIRTSIRSEDGTVATVSSIADGVVPGVWLRIEFEYTGGTLTIRRYRSDTGATNSTSLVTTLRSSDFIGFAPSASFGEVAWALAAAYDRPLTSEERAWLNANPVIAANKVGP